MNTQKQKQGFTLVEVLISLAIMSMLLVAIAAAMNASLNSYHQNDQIATATQVVRSVLNRMTYDIRTAQTLAVTSHSITIIPPTNPDNITEIEYQYTSGKLLYIITQNGTPSTYILIDNPDQDQDEQVRITNLAIDWDTGEDWQGLTCTKTVTVNLEVTIGETTHVMTATAAPRRNLIY